MKSNLKILLLYKNSTYAGYFLSNRKRSAKLRGLYNSEEIKRFRRTHENHFWALAYIEAVLKNRGLKFTKICRGTSVNYSKYDLIITFGGDGTFMEAARNIKKQLIWGVNSDPSWSVGRFCSGNPKNFEPMLDAFLKNKSSFKIFNRIELSFNNDFESIDAVNDLLICHQNPGAISRYYLKVGNIKEEQRSSGVWVSTAAGSSAGIHSAGGKVLPEESKLIQYRPRELYRGHRVSYELTGSVIRPTQILSMTSLMREGVIFVDGSHVCFPFSFGTKVTIRRSSRPLKVIWL